MTDPAAVGAITTLINAVFAGIVLIIHAWRCR